MKKNLIYFIIFLFTLSVSSQIKNGKIIYSVVAKKLDNKVSASMKEQIDALKKEVNQYKFELNFNEFESCFKLIPQLSQNKSYSTCLFAGIKTGFYYSKTEKVSKFIYNSPNGDIAINEEQKSLWKLTGESKLIENFLCFKAVSLFYGEYGWMENPKFYTTAWFCPKIPASFGPNGYHELPGLILQLESMISVLTASKINLNIEKVEIDTFKNLNLVTYEKALKLQYTNTPMLDFVLKDYYTQIKESDRIQKLIDENKIETKILDSKIIEK